MKSVHVAADQAQLKTAPHHVTGTVDQVSN